MFPESTPKKQESLREALLSSRSHLQELEKELEHQKVERQQLLEDLREKQQEVLHFREERLSLQENDSRLQHKLVLLQQQCEEKQQLFESLQSELQIYEALYGNSKKGLKAYSLDACHQIPLSSDLSHLVAEVRALRGQLEQSIQGNNCLRLQLQQQLDSSAGKASLSPSSVNQIFPASADPGNKQLLLQDSAVSPPVRDVAMNSPALVLPSSASSTPGSATAIIHRTNGLGLDTSPVMKTPPKLEGDATDGSFANKHGRHVIGHIDDYSALRQQIAEGKLLVKKIVSLVLGSKGIHELRSSTSALHHALEESASLLTVFWRAALPSTHIPVLPGKVGESTERELLELRTKVSKQEQLLQSTAERLKTANQQKESMEQFIVSQLTRTHDVLKKARTNLEVRKLLHQSEAPSLSPTHHHPLADLVGDPWPALAFQEKIWVHLQHHRSSVGVLLVSVPITLPPRQLLPLYLGSLSHCHHLSFLLQFFFFDAESGDWRNAVQLTLEVIRHSGVCLGMSFWQRDLEASYVFYSS
ncbi:hypothetical protein H8959_017566 [Pygathrix nigripes]